MLMQLVQTDFTEFCHAAEAQLARAARQHAKSHGLYAYYLEIAVPAINLLLLSIYGATSPSSSEIDPDTILPRDVALQSLGANDLASASTLVNNDIHHLITRLASIIRWTVVTKARMDKRPSATLEFDLGDLLTAAIAHVHATEAPRKTRHAAPLSALAPVHLDRRSNPPGAYYAMNHHPTADHPSPPPAIPAPWVRTRR